MTDWNAVGARIRALREARGLTQAALGEAVGSSANYVTKVENGLGISDKKLDLYATELRVSVPFLRYGVVGDERDIAQVQAIARAEGRRTAFAEMQRWAAAQGRRSLEALGIQPDGEKSLEQTLSELTPPAAKKKAAGGAGPRRGKGKGK